MFIERMITWVPSGFSGYIWLDTKIVLKKMLINAQSASLRNFIAAECIAVNG